MEIKPRIHFQFETKAIAALIVFAIWGLIITPTGAYSNDGLTPLIVIRTDSKDFDDSMEGLRSELDSDFSIHELYFSDKLRVTDIEKKVQAISPKLVILMDNKSISLYKKYQQTLGRSSSMMPSISIMGVFMDLALQGIENATGIAYEVPIVTSIVSLRGALNKKFKKIGIIHRDILNDFINTNKIYCTKEGVEIINYEISSHGNISKSVKKNLKRLLNKDKVDALWVPNDNNLLNRKILQDVWIPFAQKFKKPIIVGVDVLVNPKFNFGTFAVIPDHKSLGMQAAEKVFEIMDNDWQIESTKIDPPTSVYKIINFQQINRWYGISEDKIKNVDKIVK